MGWLPFLLESLDYQFDENGVDDLELRPSEYFRRQIYGSYWFESDIGAALDKLGEDNLMFETDFPACDLPVSRRARDSTSRDSVGGFSRPSRTAQAALRDGCARVYRLPKSPE